MANYILFGAQWGDEGKGKIVDMLSNDLDYVVRYQGGNNAGHTVIVGEEKHILHIIPSGILHDGTKCIIGNGVVLDLEVFLQEVDTLTARGIDASPDRIRISFGSHLILDYHKELDKAREETAEDKIGTTGRGIGPCYEDKKARVGIRAGDLFDMEIVCKKIEYALQEKNILLENLYNTKPIKVDDIFKKLVKIAPRIIPYLTDTAELVHSALKAKRSLLFEGAQGVMLDIDHGTYPFVTSSNTIADNAGIGTGVSNSLIENRLAVVKAYTTRVGSGPFPTELDDEIGKRLQTIGDEFGATTGRTRRCGWLDVVILRETARLCNPTDIALTKLDVLTGLEEIKICTHYHYNGQDWQYMPQMPNAFAHMKPVYEVLPGWTEDISKCRSFEELPENAQNYIRKIELLTQIKITIVSVGPKREETFKMN